MRGALHDTFTVVTAHTAKCDICNKNNKSEMYRCSKCGRQQCTPCWERNNSDGRHQLHNKDVLKYKGPKAEDLPPKEDPKAVKTGAPPSAQVSGRKRRLNAVTPVTPSSSIGVYAPTASSSPSDIQDYESTKKRVRLVEIEEDTDEDADGEAVTNRTGYPLLAPKDKPDGSVKQQRVPETPANQGSLDVSLFS